MTHAQSFAYRLRWILLVLGVLLTAFGIWGLFGFWPIGPDEDLFGGSAGVAGTPLGLPIGESFGDEYEGSPFVTPWGLDPPGYFVNAGLVLGLVLLMQWVFLRPRRGWMPRLARCGRPMKLSLIVAAFMAMVVTVGLVLALMEAGHWSKEFLSLGIWAVWSVMGTVWLIWGLIFLFQYKQTRDRYTWMTRVLNRLIGGSFLEMFVATGVYAWNPQKEEQCFCARGSYASLIFGGTVLIWAFGPGLILLFMRERYRRERVAIQAGGGYCGECGYDLRGSTGTDSVKCPECGELNRTD